MNLQQARDNHRLHAHEHSAQLAAIVDSSDDAIIGKTLDGIIISWNAGAERMFGYSQKEAVGSPLLMIFPPDRVAEESQILARIARGESIEHFETVRVTKGGIFINVSVTISPIKDGDGRIVGASKIARDITGRKRTEEALHLRSAALNASANSIMITDLKGIVRWVNPAFTALTGYSAEEAIGKNPRQLVKSGKQDRVFYKDMWDTILAGNIWRGETINCRKDGSLYTEDQTISPVRNDHGEITHFIAIKQDITERKQVQDKLILFRSLIDHTNDAIEVVDPETSRILDVNEKACLAHGYTREEYLALTLPEIDPIVASRPWKEVAKEVQRLGSNVFESQHRRKDGSIFPVEVNASYIRLDRDYFLAVVRDITARKAAEQKLVQTEAHLAQAQKMEAIGQLTGGIAHDFNNRLTVIIGNLELMQRKLGDDTTVGNQISTILSAAEGASDLTRKLLAFSRQQILEPKVLKLNELITGMRDMLQRTLGETVKIVISEGPDLWPVWVDHTMLENVLINLAVNARDAMPRGGQLTFETSNRTLDATYSEVHRAEIRGDYVLLMISDSGEGMSKEVMQKAFEPFFTTKPVGKGTGLGLAMVYGFVKQSGGHIEVYSELGQGTTFKIYLPRDGSIKGASHTPSEKKASNDNAIALGKVILLVEDDDAVRKLSTMQLTEMGCKVLTADSGPAALDLFVNQPGIDLLVTDMIMPGGMTGLELAAKLRERRPELRALYTSGYAPQAAADRRIKEHPNDFWLMKPYRYQALKDAIHRALGSNI